MSRIKYLFIFGLYHKILISIFRMTVELDSCGEVKVVVAKAKEKKAYFVTLQDVLIEPHLKIHSLPPLSRTPKWLHN